MRSIHGAPSLHSTRGDKLDVLVITPPKSADVRRMISRSYPGYPGVDSVPLRAASVLENGGFSVKFLPLYNLFYNFSPYKDTEDLIAYLAMQEADVFLLINDYYIFSRSTPSYEASLITARLIKERNSNAHIILAGNHVSSLPHAAFLDSPHVDVVVKLEGEPLYCDLVERLQKGSSLQSLKGLVYREHSRVKETPGYGTVGDFNSLPVPAYHLLRPWAEEIPRRMGRVSGLLDTTLRTSYGCPNRCAFCGVTPNWNICRYRSADSVLEDISYAKETLKGKRVDLSYFDDENFTCTSSHVTSISRMMQKEDIHIDGVLASVPDLTTSMVEDISRFSTSVLMGAENACDSVLAFVGKKQTFQQVLRACGNARGKLKVHLQWVIGLPGEDSQTIPINLNAIFTLLMKGDASSVTPHLLGPQPGSDIGDQPERYGVTIHSKTWSHYHAHGYPVSSTTTLTREQIYFYFSMAQIVALEGSQMRGVFESHRVEPIISGPEVDLFSTFMEEVTI